MAHMITLILLATRSTYRNFRKNWLYGSLNLLGLVVAFATLILVVSYLHEETTYESFHQKADRIFRPTYHFSTQSNYDVHFARIPNDFINNLPEEIPEIEKLIRFQNKEQRYVRIGERRFKPKHAYITDHDVFEVFDLPLISGSSSSALLDPYSIVLTQSEALKYFSRTDVLGEEIVVTGDWSAEEQVYKVTGVMEDLPANSHLPIELLFSFTNEEERSGWAYIYTLLSKGADIADVEAKMPDFVDAHTNPQSNSQLSFKFQPLPDIHLNSDLAREIKPNGQMIYIKIFFWVGVFVWMIALVNFTNLSTALAMSKGKEVGVRRVLGATNSQLILFSMLEAVIYSIIAMVLGLVVATIFFPTFSQLTGISILPEMKFFIPFLVGLALFSGLIAGVLPTLVITSIDILQSMKQGSHWSKNLRGSNINTKRILITIQFCATITLISSAVIAYGQFGYINNKNLGLKSEQIVAITEVPEVVKEKYSILKNQFLQLPGVKKVSACMQVPSSEIRDVGPVLVRGVNEDAAQAPMMDMQIIDPDFIEMMNLEFVAGEDYTSSMALGQFPHFDQSLTMQDYLANATRGYLINETAMRQLGWTDPVDAIGQQINWSIGNFELAYGPVKGVIKDYHQESLKNTVDPIVMTVEPLWLGNFLIQVETAMLEETLAEMEAIWNDLFPYTLEYHFLDELFDRLYYQDRVQLQLLSILTLIAILISFIGLVSLVAFALHTRSKEIAIRRVIGANLRSLTVLIGKEYFWMLAIAIVVATPVSYYWVTKWLQNFAYHIDISPIPYILSAMIICLLLFTTIYVQSYSATVDNPVKALREE